MENSKIEYKKAIFFDRDGVVNMRAVKDYIKNEDEFQFLPDFLDFFQKIVKTDYLVFLITNQQGVSKGLMTEEQLQSVLSFMQERLVEKFGKGFDDIFYCTDLADSGSYFRKPNPGMIMNTVDKWNLNGQKSWVIGDSPSDVTAGRRAGLKTVLLGDYKIEDISDADYIIKNLFVIEDFVPILD
ncbi:MAG: HAD-IIIA family hydrolase [bacterium]